MARPKLGEGETQRLHVKISDEEMTAIDDWRFANRVSSRSEAVRRLCQMALAIDRERNNLAAALHSEMERSKEYTQATLELLEELGVENLGATERRISFVKAMSRQYNSSVVLSVKVSSINGLISACRNPEGGLDDMSEQIDSLRKFAEEALSTMAVDSEKPSK